MLFRSVSQSRYGFELQEQDESGEFHNAYLEFMQNNHTFDESFIERKKEKKKKKQASLDNFIGEENGESNSGLDQEFNDGVSLDN